MSPLYAVSELTQVISLNLPMVGAVDFAKGDFLKEYGISEMLSTFEVSSIFSRASQRIFTPCHKAISRSNHYYMPDNSRNVTHVTTNFSQMADPHPPFWEPLVKKI